jgi:hypothetical protein
MIESDTALPLTTQSRLAFGGDYLPCSDDTVRVADFSKSFV